MAVSCRLMGSAFFPLFWGGDFHFSSFGLSLSSSLSPFQLSSPRHYAPFLSTPVSWDDTALDVYRIILDAVVLFLLLVWVLFAAARFVREHSLGKQYDPIISLVTGAMFGAGLSLSGMARRSKVTGFLTIADQWDPR